MALARNRLDRFISQKMAINKRDVRLILAQGRVTVDGTVAKNIEQIIDTFSYVILDGKTLQNNAPYYVMLNKPTGVVSATKDDQHKTVIDLLKANGIQDKDDRYKDIALDDLHIVGRLDLNSSGLLLLTNDSRWSERLTQPDKKVAKVYQVTLKYSLTEDCFTDYVEAFANGMYFEFENITTRPAKITLLSEFTAEVTLVEGRYHQIKRMFGRFRNPVVGLHRISIGSLDLDYSLPVGESRLLEALEIDNIT
jgi:16S rRNA pseudouridine516 synthase